MNVHALCCPTDSLVNVQDVDVTGRLFKSRWVNCGGLQRMESQKVPQRLVAPIQRRCLYLPPSCSTIRFFPAPWRQSDKIKYFAEAPM